MIRLTLYTTLGCHLCEQLEAWLGVLAANEHRLEKVEISKDDRLLERFGERIPVLVDADGDELERGFEAPRLAAWLGERGWLDEVAWRAAQEGEEPRSATRGAEMRDGRRYLSSPDKL
ncbi:glutaredoxin family protein [Halomonas sp. THAF12]|uniref:glutaredoxin family protein n=1 Tax=Halomonas sp. B23F22_10 TaxID=3459515 RepID=UPI00373E48BC